MVNRMAAKRPVKVEGIAFTEAIMPTEAAFSGGQNADPEPASYVL